MAIQTGTWAKNTNVSAPSFARREPFKIKVGKPLASHVQVVLTVLPALQVVCIQPLLVRPGHLRMARRLVTPVVQENTMTKQAKTLAKIVQQEHTKTKPENHPAKHAVLVNFR